MPRNIQLWIFRAYVLDLETYPHTSLSIDAQASTKNSANYAAWPFPVKTSKIQCRSWLCSVGASFFDVICHFANSGRWSGKRIRIVLSTSPCASRRSPGPSRLPSRVSWVTAYVVLRSALQGKTLWSHEATEAPSLSIRLTVPIYHTPPRKAPVSPN